MDLKYNLYDLRHAKIEANSCRGDFWSYIHLTPCPFVIRPKIWGGPKSENIMGHSTNVP